MFRLTTNADLIDLKMTNPGDIFPTNKAFEWSWGLKSFGYMLAFREALKLRTELGRVSILEAGIGLGAILYHKVREFADFVGVDQVGFYSEDAFRVACDQRKEMRFVDGLMGDFNSAIPDSSIDLTCSISVLEHVPQDKIDSVVADLARVTKSGGRFVHTLDVHRGKRAVWEAYKNALDNNGFKFDQPPQPIDFTVDGLLYEPLAVVFRAYEKNQNTSISVRSYVVVMGRLQFSQRIGRTQPLNPIK